MPLRHGSRRTAAPGSLIGTERIRSLRIEDLPDLVALRRRAFRFGERDDPVDLAAYCERVFFRNPWRDEELPSLVYQDAEGRPAGFIGVIPRQMLLYGQPIRVAVATQMMVAPEARGLAGRQLVRALLSGPQDLTLSDTANDSARRVWTSVGAENVLLYGFTWERVLRPLRRMRYRLLDRSLPVRAAAFAARPLFAAGDAVASGLQNRYRPPRPAGTLEPLDPATIAEHADRVLADHALRPAFEAPAFGWLLSEAAQKHELGTLAGGMVRAPNGELAGWFAHYAAPGRISHVLQLAARKGAHDLVMGHLLHDAWQRKSIAVSGRVDPSLLPTLGSTGFCLRHEKPWTLAYSRRPEILRTIERGKAFLSRLDGEWWLSF